MFADLGLPNADEEAAKVDLAFEIKQIIEDRGLTQTEAAKTARSPFGARASCCSAGEDLVRAGSRAAGPQTPPAGASGAAWSCLSKTRRAEGPWRGSWRERLARCPGAQRRGTERRRAACSRGRGNEADSVDPTSSPSGAHPPTASGSARGERLRSRCVLRWRSGPGESGRLLSSAPFA